ncbi:MAG: DNA alkylation repair protein [Candidatus Falkowbacteria bacterium]|nr:DNA alkylation repair protein [Candidatus Falkowbacteria bacterium]
MSDLQKLIKEIKSHENKPQASVLRRFFKTGPGQYGAGDRFLGLYVPLQRLLARKYAHLSFLDIKGLLKSKIHEFRLIGLFILVDQYEKSAHKARKKKIVDFYLAHTDRINNWDLVDLSVYKILGDFLVAQKIKPARQILDKMAVSDNIWERRMAIVSTFAFIKSGKTEETFRLAVKLLKDKHNLIHKAVGWMLREAGKRGGVDKLRAFLDIHYKKMSRLTLRYALERLSARDRKHYLSKN